MNIPSRCSFLILSALTVSSVQPAYADRMLEMSSMCSKHFARAEREHGIPKHLLAAVSLQETGRYNKSKRSMVPWPWAVNVEGKGYYFDTMHEAVTFVKRQKMKGKTSIDVGCMQVNLHHHPDAFVSVSESFLKENFREARSWRNAVAWYHSRNSRHGTPYYAKVRERWRQIIAGGGLNTPDTGGSYVVAVNDKNPSPHARLNATSKTPRTFELSLDGEANFKPLGKRQELAVAVKKAKPSIRVIQVDNQSKNKQSPEVLVVRPVKAEMQAVAHAAPPADPEFLLDGEGEPAKSAEVISTDSEKKQRSSSRKKGPNFIFE
jgi:hypothetical protein